MGVGRRLSMLMEWLPICKLVLIIGDLVLT